MDWEIILSRQAEKFLAQQHLADNAIVEPVLRGIQKLQDKIVAVDVKQLTGKWANHFRIRVGKNRIIFSIDFENQTVLVEIFDNRGSAYK